MGTFKKIKAFMASPSDTTEERTIFVEVIESINRSRGDKERVHIEPIIWEKYAYPEIGHPQKIINTLFEDAELLIVAFWNKFGMSTLDFPSGTMEEFSLCYERRKETGFPAIKMYFRELSSPQSISDIDEQKKILEFKEAIKDIALYCEYKNADEFKDKLQEHVNAWLTDYLSRRDVLPCRIIEEPSLCKDIVRDCFRKIEEKFDSEISKIKFGLDSLDAILPNIEDLNFIAIGGDVSSGKTSLLLTLLKITSIDNEVPALFFSTISTKENIVQRLISNVSQVNNHSIRIANLTKSDWPKLASSAGKVASVPLYIDDNPSLSIEELKTQITKSMRSHEIKLVVIDGLYYIKGESNSLGKTLKLISRELQIPIIGTFQLSTVHTRVDTRPVLKDVDGDIPVEADAVILLHRQQIYGGDYDRRKIEITIAKNNIGPTGNVYAVFLPQFCAIYEEL